jgi:tetratricopeptide (TPR) repeat protein
VAAVLVAAAAAWWGTGALAHRALTARIPALPDLTAVPASVARAVRDADAAARQSPSAASIGALGRTYHANQIAPGALAAYAIAETLDAGEWTWTYLRALVLEERGAAETEAALVSVVGRAPALGDAWYRLGELRLKQGRLDDAATAYEHAVNAAAPAPFQPADVAARQVWPVRVYASLGLARVALERGQPDQARARLRGVLGSYPAFGPARAMLRRLDAAADPAQAGAPALAGSDAPFVPPADPLLDAVVASSAHSDVLLKHAGQATRAGDAAWREFLVRRAATLAPTDLNVLMELAAMLQATNRPAEALEVLKKHETLAPGDHHTLVQQGRVLSELDRLDEAEAVLRRAVAVRDAAAEFNLGTVLDRHGRWDEAHERYTRALAINPFHARAMNNLGIGLNRRGRSAEAATWFERAMAIAPNDADVYVNYGGALIQLRRFDDAVRVLRDAIALDPRSANAQNNLGIALASRGDLPGALDAFTRALDLAPNHADARANRARVAAALGR